MELDRPGLNPDFATLFSSNTFNLVEQNVEMQDLRPAPDLPESDSAA